jgi:hypothetical protein
MNDTEGQHDGCPEGGYVIVPLGQITKSETTRVADRVTGGPGRRPTTFDPAL